MSAPCIQFDDPITLVLTQPSSDGYGTEELEDQADIMAAIDFNTGYSHGANQDDITSDAIARISPNNQFVRDNFNRLEEMLILIDLFNTPDQRAWYKVIKVGVARDTQLCNDIDHLELQLKKTAPLSELLS